MTYRDNLIERAERIADSLLTHEPLAECPFPRGMQADAYAAGRASAVIPALVEEIRLLAAELEASREVAA